MTDGYRHSSAANLAPPYSLVFLLDPDVGELPLALSGETVSEGSSSIAIATRAEVDGTTEFAISQHRDHLGMLELIYKGELQTSGCLALTNVELEVIVSMVVPPGLARFELWADRALDPHIVRIVVL